MSSTGDASDRSAKAPVSARTSISAYFAGSAMSCLLSTVARYPSANAIGTEASAGFFSGKIAKSTLGNIDFAVPDTAGDKIISTTELIRPPYMLHSTPLVLNRIQNKEYRIVGRFAEAATAKASATRNAT